MRGLPFLSEPGALYAAGPDAHEPYTHDDEWTLIGRTDPNHCSAQGNLWELGLNEANLTPTPAAPFAARATLSWDSDDGMWRVIASVRAPEPGSIRVRRPTVTIWPICAVLESPARVVRLQGDESVTPATFTVSDWIVPIGTEPETCRAYKAKRIGDGYVWGHRCGLPPDHEGDHELERFPMAEGGPVNKEDSDALIADFADLGHAAVRRPSQRR